MNPDVRFNSVEQILRLINEIPLELREEILSAAIKDLPVDVRLRVLGLSDLTGNIVNLNSDISVYFQNSNGNNGFEFDKLFNAIIDYKRSLREQSDRRWFLVSNVRVMSE